MKLGKRAVQLWMILCVIVGLAVGNGRENVCAGAKTDGDFEYYYVEWAGGAEITKYTGNDTELTIPEKVGGYQVVRIGQYAFEGCHTLKSILIPSGVDFIVSGSFQDCSNLAEINVRAGNSEYKSENGILYDKEGTELKACPAGKAGEITVPKGICEIGGSAFYRCNKIESIKIPSTVERIGMSAFGECNSLTEINVDAGNPYFKSEEGILYYEDSEDGKRLKYFPGGKSGEIVVPEGVGGINSGAFSECDKIEKIKLPSTVKDIGADFSNCDNLMEIEVDAGNDSYKSVNGMLYNKDGTELVSCPGGKSGEVTILESVKVIGDGAFEGCRKIESVRLPSAVKSISFYAFDENLKSIEVDADNPNFKSIDGILYGKDGTELLRYPGGKAEIVKIPAGISKIGESAFYSSTKMKEIELPPGVKEIGHAAFSYCTNLKSIKLPAGLTTIGDYAFEGCENLISVEIPEGVSDLGMAQFNYCRRLQSIFIPASVKIIDVGTLFSGANLSMEDIYYAGSKKQWKKMELSFPTSMPVFFDEATIHYNAVASDMPQGSQTSDMPQGSQTESMSSAKQALESLKAGDALSLEPAFQPYFSAGQIDVMESCLYTWLAGANYAYQYSGSSGVKECMMKKAGIDPGGDFASGKGQAVTHITVDTKYGDKTFEITLDLGKPDSSGNLYPAYGAMHYELLQKEGVPADVSTSGQIGKSDYADLGTFAQCFGKAAESSLRNTYQWQSFSDEMTAGVLADKTIIEIIGDENGSFSDGTFTLYAKPLITYSKKVTIACPVDVRVFTMDGKDAGSIVDGQKSEKDENVSLHVEGDTKVVFLSGDDYCLELRGTDTGTMDYKVEEFARLEEAVNEEVRRTVQFLELQLKKDLQYEGYVFRPLNIDSSLYALNRVNGSSKETILPKEDTYKPVFKKVQGLSLSNGGTATLDQNGSVQLEVSLYPLDASNQGLQWTTDNQSVVSVDGNGLVTAVGAGSATVTVSTKDGSFLKQDCVFLVKGADNGTDDPKPAPEPENPSAVVLQFQPNGGVNLSRKVMTLLADDSPGIMPKIQRRGYVFDGWYTQQNGGEQVTGDEPLRAAATLYAHWIKAKTPKKASAPTLKSMKKGQMKVSFEKVKGAAGYQLQYSTKKGFASKKIKQFGVSAKARTISGLKAGKKYYVRVRAYSTDSMGNKVYGKYSKAKSVKIKA